MDDNTKEEIKTLISDTLKDKAIDILRAATENADKIVEERLKKGTATLRDDLDEQLASKTQGEHSFKNNINESNFDFCKKIDDIWRKTERAVEEKDKTKTKELLKKGRDLLENRMQALIIADKEGWDVALAYVSDPLVRTAEQEKRLKKARREAQAAKDSSSKKKRDSENARFGPKRSYQNECQDGSSRKRQNNLYGNLDRRSWGPEPKKCWRCGAYGHLSTRCTAYDNCSRRTYNN